MSSGDTNYTRSTNAYYFDHARKQRILVLLDGSNVPLSSSSSSSSSCLLSCGTELSFTMLGFMFIVFVSILLLVLISDTIYGAPRAILHIGPYKTSSSRIQGILVKLVDELALSNFYLPPYKTVNGKGNPKGTAWFALAWHGYYGVNATAEINFMNSFLAESLRLNRNIILSSEVFVILNESKITSLQEMLRGFEVVVTFVYRDILSQMLSLHFESNRFEHKELGFSSSFSSYLLRRMDNMTMTLRPLDALHNYATVFGIENLRIIDLHGTAAAKKEVTHVILCQVAGVLCHHTNLSSIAVFSNPSYSLIPAQVFSHFKVYALRRKNGACQFRDTLFSNYQYFAERYLNETKLHDPPANITTKLTMLLPYAHNIDSQLRKTYHNNILEGNREVNLKRMAQVKVQELNEDAFLEDLYWDKWIHSEFLHARETGRLHQCKNYIA